MRNKKMAYDMYIHWTLLDECNFSCSYCTATPKKGRPKKIDIDRVIQRLDKFNKTMLITFTGGEPFLIPNFTEFIYELTKKHYIRIDTNLSLIKACEEFIHTINPEKVLEISFSVHLQERQKRKIDLHELCSLVNKFQETGFNIIGNYVMYPPLNKRLKDDIDFFNVHGIKVLPTLFNGKFGKRIYPINGNTISYSEKELQLITKINPYAATVICKTKNEPCNAGSTAFRINSRYEVYPCFGIQKKLGNFFGEWDIFSKVIRCPANYCFCQFNKNFSASPGTTQQVDLLDKTIADKGIFSKPASYILTEGIYRALLEITHPLRSRFGLRRSSIYKRINK